MGGMSGVGKTTAARRVARRYDNDAAIDQWRRYAEHEPRARELTIDFACECDQPGCESVVEVSFDRTIHRPFLGHRATVRP